jgi:hypothetical protein
VGIRAPREPLSFLVVLAKEIRAGGPNLTNRNNLGAPSSARLLRLMWGIRAPREPSPLNSPYFAEPNRTTIKQWKNNLHIAGCLTLKNKSTLRSIRLTEKLHPHKLA